MITAETINVLRKLLTAFQDGTSLILIQVSHWELCAENMNQPFIVKNIKTNTTLGELYQNSYNSEYLWHWDKNQLIAIEQFMW